MTKKLLRIKMFYSEQFIEKQFIRKQFAIKRRKECIVIDLCNKKAVGFRIRKLDNLMMRNMLACSRVLGLDEVTVMNGWILGYLSRNSEHDIFQKDVEAYFGIGRSTVTNIIKLMEKKQLIRRESVERDARLKKLVLTDKGRDADEKVKTMMDWMEQSLLEGITQEEQAGFYRMLDKLQMNLKRQKEEIKCLKL